MTPSWNRILVLGALALGFATVSAQTAPERDPNMRQAYSGAAMMFSIPDITLVYPAGQDEDAERNRISAERRAAYLTGRHGIETLVVADRDFTADHHDDNLLVLGWNNALLAKSGQVALTENGWNFQGLERGFDRDLLFAWVSPFDSQNHFIFWSRIDPELDRYLVLPFFGSDWVVFERYFVEQYGRFDKTTVRWPPQRDTGAMIDNRDRNIRPKPRQVSEHYELHDLARLTDQEVVSILDARETAWSACVKTLGAPPEPRKIKLFVYRDSTAKEESSWVHEARHHMPASLELHLTKVIALNPANHEDAHLVARQLFGPGYLTLMVEGLAVWTEQQQGTNELPIYASMLAGSGAAVPTVSELLDEETLRVLIRKRSGLTYAGLFVSWLHDHGGLEAIGRVYGIYPSDAALLARTLDIPAAELDRRFHGYVQAQAKLGEPETAFRAALEEGRHFSKLGDYERAVPALIRALEMRPEHTATRYQLALLQIALDDLAGARTNLEAILAAPPEPQQDTWVILTWFQLGELHARNGETRKARKAYETVLDLPDQRELHAGARKALDSLP